ncbi:UDP-glycosyltransferase 89B2-like [Zingiber officinale]|uniref:UDP-glycosyltransferase 89B2-like n=1 Tax=Zingiber officinale TaxID=94328 RepID=UPI001C4B792E|nr:UDP-glycosyltransferase 89B2-like [Zingiber officinale]
MAEAEQRNHLLVVPFPAPSHMLPLLDLAYFLSSSFGFAVTVVVTPKNLPCLSPLLSRAPAVSPLVLPFPGDSDLPPGVEDAQGLRFPHVNTLLRALGGLHGPILRWAEEAAAAYLPVSAVLSDFFLGWTHRLAADLGVPRLVFSPSGAAALAVQHSLWRRLPQRTNFDDAEELIPFPSVPRSPLYPWRQLPTLFKIFKQGDRLSEFVRDGFLGNIDSWAFVINTFSELEKPYLDHLRDDLGHERVWAVGPLSLVGGGSTTERDAAVEELFAWLDSCIEASVVYVAFGSLAVLPPAQVSALAAGLEKSGARFVWAAKGVEETIPERFEERVAGRGRVLRGWAPQTAILSHPAVGAFLSHCGWNSVLEAVAAGVPVLTWPISADQYTNARLLKEELGMGTVAYEGGEPAPDPTELARVVTQSVGEAGRARREKAKDASRAMAAAVQEYSGSSYMNLAALKEELSRSTSLKAI